MGALIHLSIDDFEVDWGKNSVFTMHGDLFQRADLGPRRVRVESEDGQPEVENVDAASRTLRRMVPRLELLGYTVSSAREHFHDLQRSMQVQLGRTSFHQMATALRRLDIDAATKDYHQDYEYGRVFANEILRLETGRPSKAARMRRFEWADVMQNYDPRCILRLLAENPANLERRVTWYYGDVVNSGWVREEPILASIGTVDRFLVVTEGSSDAHVIRHALSLLRPDISDFFDFVDMEKGYPFTGTGNLYRFCQGLASIGIKNSVIVVYDNDTEGRAKFNETQKLKLPRSMRVMHLPTHRTLRRVMAIGPGGERLSDINGRAASIECYLDMQWRSSSVPRVRWTTFSADAGQYQGSLEAKSDYVRNFLKLKRKEAGYNFERMEVVLDELVRNCVAIACRN